MRRKRKRPGKKYQENKEEEEEEEEEEEGSISDHEDERQSLTRWRRILARDGGADCKAVPA